MSQNLSGMIGGSPAAVLLRLLVVSFVAGLILVAMGFQPETLYENVLRMGRRLVEYGFSDVREIGRTLLTGAMVVIPVWIILRLINARRGR